MISLDSEKVTAGVTLFVGVNITNFDNNFSLSYMSANTARGDDAKVNNVIAKRT